MIKEFVTGVVHFFTAFGFIFNNRLAKYYFYPIIAALLLYFGLFSYLIVYSKALLTYLIGPYLPEHLPEVKGLGSIGTLIANFSLYGLAAILFSILIILLASKFSKYIILILLSPVFAFLSEAVEEKLTGKSYPFRLHEFISDVIRGIILALRNLFIELLWIMLIGIIGLFVPALGLLLTPLGILISAYFYGFSMIDYINERRRMNISESVQKIRKYKWFAIGNGLMYWFFDSIPIVGWFIAPVNSVTGACTGMHELEQ